VLERLHFILGGCVDKGTQDSDRTVTPNQNGESLKEQGALAVIICALCDAPSTIIFIIIIINDIAFGYLGYHRIKQKMGRFWVILQYDDDDDFNIPRRYATFACLRREKEDTIHRLACR